MNRLFLTCLGLCVLLASLSGCGIARALLEKGMSGSGAVQEESSLAGSSSSLVQGSRVEPEDGFAGGRIGDAMATAFFDFTILSAEKRAEYEGYVPAEGYILVDTAVKVYNTFGETVPMFASDFQIQWGDGDEDYGYPVQEITGEQAVPEQYSLHPFETVEYHHVYEVPEGTEEYSVSFLELYEDESQGDVFFVYFELK